MRLTVVVLLSVLCISAMAQYEDHEEDVNKHTQVELVEADLKDYLD